MDLLLRCNKIFFWFFFACFLVIAEYYAFFRGISFAELSDGQLQISDLQYHLLLIKALWNGNIHSIYAVDSQLIALQTSLGGDVHAAMPVGVLPFAIVLWGPLARFSESHAAFSANLWGGFSLSVFVAALNEFFQKIRAVDRLPFALLCFVSITSDVAIRGLVLGQTSLVGVGAAIFVVLNAYRETRSWKFPELFFPLALFLMLGLKMPYLIFGYFVLLASRSHKMLGSVTVFLVTILFIISLKFSSAWIGGYLQQLRIYLTNPLPQEYAGSLAYETMNTFASVLVPTLSQNAALRVGNILFLLGTFAPLFRLSRLRPLQAPAFFLGSYLLFCPILGAYEDLFLLVLGGLVFFTPDGDDQSPVQKNGVFFYLGIGCLFLLLNYRSLWPDLPVWSVWICKLLFVSYTLVSLSRKNFVPDTAQSH